MAEFCPTGGFAITDQSTDFESIARGIAEGSVEAESAFVQSFHRPLRYLLMKRCRDPMWAEDLCQETLLTVLKRLRSSTIDKPEKLSSFVHNTAINLWKNDTRKQVRRKTVADEDIASLAVSEAEQSNFISRFELRSLVRRLIDELPTDRDRKILTEVYLRDSPKEEVCEELGLSAAHFDRVIYRARQRFKKLFEEYASRQDAMLQE